MEITRMGSQSSGTFTFRDRQPGLLLWVSPCEP
jgi:hypothetical protein